MLKKLISFSNPVGFILTTATIILAVSPEARKGTRKMLVKGAGAVLALGDQMKGLTTEARLQIDSVMNEAREEKENMMLPDFVEMAKNTGNRLKNSFEAGLESFEETKDISTPSMVKTEGLFDNIEPVTINEIRASNEINDKVIKDKLNEIDKQFRL